MAEVAKTTYLKLDMPGYSDPVDIAQITGNFDKVENKIKNLERGGGATATPYDLKTLAQIVNRTYEGVDLTVKYASEIAKSPYNGDEWKWIQGRIQAANFEGIWVGDYIPFSAGGYNFKAEIAGIDTYYGFNIAHHIDFVTREVWPIAHAFNKADYNNGTTVSSHPWLASDLYAWLNSLDMSVPAAQTANPQLVSVYYNRDKTGVYDKLPEKLKQVIVAKLNIPVSVSHQSGVRKPQFRF